MKQRLWLVVFGGAILGIGGFLVAASGIIPTKASSGHWAVTEWFLRFSMKRSIATHSIPIKVPANLADPALVVKGATAYEMGCRSCHGEPGRPPPPIALHMLPVPPDLAVRVRESNPKRLFYVVKHGLKFTGMPAWPSPHRDDEVWAIVAFLLHYPDLDTAAYRRLVQRDSATVASMETLGTAADVSPTALQSCMRCHGPDGRGRGTGAFPKLAGQREDYLRGALEAYATGRRHSGIMGPIAAGLDAQEIRGVVGYFSIRPTLPPGSLASTSQSPTAAAIERGRVIALEGIPNQRVPSCVECHGPGAKRGKPDYPILVGQPADYLQLQLQLFKHQQRGGSAYAHLMRPIAARLTDEQMRDAALYFESLTTTETGTQR